MLDHKCGWWLWRVCVVLYLGAWVYLIVTEVK